MSNIPKKRARIPKASNLPVVVKSGLKITSNKQEFIVGKQIGEGGFARIYDGQQVDTKESVAIKMEPLANGPLFTEMHVFMKVLKQEMLDAWKKRQGLRFLGLPCIISFGKFDYEGRELRYMIMPKYNGSLESVRQKAVSGKLPLRDVLSVARTVLNAYDYLQSQSYVHADVKAANLLLEDPKNFERVVLIDFGLARKLPDVLVEKEEKKKAHNGTMLFTSCDAHRGCLPSYRGDLEILAHNMLLWLSGSLPWEDYEKEAERTFQAKKELIENAETDIPHMLGADKKAAATLIKYYKTVRGMAFGEKIKVEALC